MANAIEVKDLYFSYGGKDVLNGLSLDIEKGSFVSIVGPNGSGKSTFLKCLNNILSYRSGSINIMGQELKKMKRNESAKKIAYVPQSTKRAFPTTVFETVLMGRRPYVGWSSKKSDEDIAWEMLRELRLEKLAMCSFDQLSGGQQQKVLIARALAQDTDIILLDEPTSDLDIWHQLDVMENVRRLVDKKKVTAIMVVHDLNLVSKYSDAMVILKDGLVQVSGKPADVLSCENIAETYGVESHVYNHEGMICVMPMKQICPCNKKEKDD